MKVVVPVVVTDAMLIASTIDEAAGEPTLWSATDLYAKGATARRGHRVYESLVADNRGNDPAAFPAVWLDLRPTNRWAMFDGVVGTRSTGQDEIVVTLRPGRVDALAILDTDAAFARVEAYVEGIRLYDVTRATTVSGELIDNWATYFFADIGQMDMLLFTGLPLYAQAELRVTLSAPSRALSVGTVLTGREYDLGLTGAGATIGINDFSIKATDAFGVTTVTERAWSKRMTIRAMVPTAAVGTIQRRLAAVRARAALWIGGDGDIGLVIYGFYKDFSVDLALPSHSYLSLTVEGII